MHFYHIWRRIGNNVVFRVLGQGRDSAVKFTIRDGRQRARREYMALRALHAAGLDLAPRPSHFDDTSFAHPVVVMDWLEGEVSAEAPKSDADWTHLVAHYATIHTVTPELVSLPLNSAVINFDSLVSARQSIAQQLAAVPNGFWPGALRRLLARLEDAVLPFSPRPPRRALCRVDANLLNFVRRPGQWMSVDWENSGWGDPAFEIVDMMTHPTFLDVSAERWEWVARRYGELSGDASAVARIHIYYPFMLVWWAARAARGLYELPRGLDQRLARKSVTKQADLQLLFDRYVQLGHEAVAEWQLA